MKHKTTFKLHKYWTDLRGSRLAPRRTEIEPANIREILADTFILNADEDQTYKFRLAGSRVCSPYCRELKGKEFLSFWSNHDFSALQTLLDAIRKDAAAAVIGWEGHNIRRQSIMFETILLPLETQDGVFNRILGSTASNETPYWLGVHPILEQKIVSMRMIWPNDKPAFDTIGLEQEPHFAAGEKPAIAIDPQSGAMARRIGHLLVYDGGKQTGISDLST